MSKKHISKEIKNFKAEINNESKNIEISWDLPDKPIKSVFLYRKAGDEKLKTYKTFFKPVNKFIDSDIRINTKYEYQLRIIYKDGKSSPFTKKQIIKY